MTTQSLFAQYDAAVQRFLGVNYRGPRSLTCAQADYLASVMAERKPSRVLELGAGLSSIVIAKYLRANKDSCGLTVDHDPAWLAFVTTQVAAFKTGNPRHSWNVLAVLRQQALERGPEQDTSDPDGLLDLRPFDLVLVDHGPKMWTRVQDMPWIMRLVAPGGIVLCDDWFPLPTKNEAWQSAMEAALVNAGLVMRVVEEAREPGRKTLLEATRA
ncbi:MAG: class I SAM-dependent methyltransferase [Lentisphaeria bacterium]